MSSYIDILRTFIPIGDEKGVSIATNNLGHINTTLKVETTAGGQIFILQKINYNIFKKPDIIVNSINVVNKHLKSNDYPYGILEILPNIKG